MTTRRDWLADKGLAIRGARGKFSNEAKSALAKAERDGVVFSDATGPAAPKRPRVEKAPKAPAPAESAYLTQDEYPFPESQYKAVGDDGKVYGMREVCNTCRVSLLGHACASPTIHGDIAVTIVPRGGRQ